MRRGLAAVGLGLAGILLALVLARPGFVLPGLRGTARVPVLIGLAWLVFAGAMWLVRRADRRTAVVAILLGAVAFPVASGIGAPPHSSDDLYRYLWDGRVQAAGIDPYRYVPAARELVDLRDDALWPPRAPWCVSPAQAQAAAPAQLAPGCTRINRPTVPTIYPPVAEAVFVAMQAMPPRTTATTTTVQLVTTVFAVATTVLLLVWLSRRRADIRLAMLWAWCPAVALEAGNNGHIDVVATFLTALALLAASRATGAWQHARAGVLFGLAVATKLTPALVAPALARRRPVVLGLAAAGALAAVYLPHVLAVGPAVLGYLPGYLTEEGYANGNRFALLTLVLPDAWAAPSAVLVLVGAALVVARVTDPDRPWLAATGMAGTALLVATPSYPWYALLLVLVVALGGRAEWLVVAPAAYLAQYAHDLHLSDALAQRIGYGTALAVVLTAHAWRRWPRTLGGTGRVDPPACPVG